MENELLEMYGRMRTHFGHLGWWPGDTPFEVAVGAILTQNTAWKNVEKAISNLKSAGALKPGAMNNLSRRELASLIRPAGYFNVKAGRLSNFLEFLFDNYGGDMAVMKKARMPGLRKELLSVNGIGPETADSILLYALGKRTFVVDAYTRRILGRHGASDNNLRYDSIKKFFEGVLPRRVGLYKDFHAQIVYVGKDFCRTGPRCEKCPLSGWKVEPHWV